MRASFVYTVCTWLRTSTIHLMQIHFVAFVCVYVYKEETSRHLRSHDKTDRRRRWRWRQFAAGLPCRGEHNCKTHASLWHRELATARDLSGTLLSLFHVSVNFSALEIHRPGMREIAFAKPVRIQGVNAQLTTVLFQCLHSLSSTILPPRLPVLLLLLRQCTVRVVFEELLGEQTFWNT